MGVFRQFPYSNFHEMNLDEIIKVVKDMLVEWAQYHAQWDEWQGDIDQAWQDMQDFINNYFDNLDVQQEINNKIISMVNSGEFGTIMQPYVPPEVTAWLADHITQPVGVVIDDSLTVEGACADAKAAGDRITACEDDIKEISESNRNLWAESDSITFTSSQVVTLSDPLPAGDYTLSAVVTSNDTDATKCRFQINSSAITRDLDRGSRAEAWFTTPDPINSIKFFAATNSTTSSGDTATWADIQIEKGRHATDYVEHELTAYDKEARFRMGKIIKFVSAADGDDNNDGETASTAYATIAKAFSEVADTIYIGPGTYTESIEEANTAYRYRGVKIVADKATLVNDQSLHFRWCNVDITGLTIEADAGTPSGKSGLYPYNCTGRISDCVVDGFPNMGFRLDGSQITLERCEAKNCGTDGFNGHTLTVGYETFATLINCVAHGNGDDGASIHESGKMYVIGGEYYDNVQAGLAPHDFCTFEAINVYCHDNEKGIEAIKDTLDPGDTPGTGNIIGCIVESNSNYGIDVKNYTVNTLGNGFANNTNGNVHSGTGATINAYTVA